MKETKKRVPVIIPDALRISKVAFYSRGGFSNPRNLRLTRNGTWAYFRTL